ncbi:MAG: hypothetical protein JST32_10170, partial [Bacteroidetes bacterium]|nr:hypothetical protein [Bacteroidota bacterium]
MKKYRYILFASCLVLGLKTMANSQIRVENYNYPILKLQQFLLNHPSEKVYLQLDKPCYAAGDTVYFKAYVTMGERHTPSQLSVVLYADLINTENKICQHTILQINNGVAWGDFAIPDNLSEGNYYIRAWTKLMLEESQSFFEKQIPIGAASNDKMPENHSFGQYGIHAKPDLQFLPESGELIAGIKNKIAFKSISADGRGMFVKGRVLDNKNKMVAVLASNHLGMGYFEITPQANKTYRADVIFGDSSRRQILLPPAAGNGMLLSVNTEDIQKVIVRVEANDRYYADNKGKTFLVVIYSGGVATSVNCKLDSPIFMFDLIKRKLFTGVTRITLFSPNNEPIGERLIFVQNYDQLGLHIQTDKQIYHPRSKTRLKLTVRTRADSTAVGHFSISVINENLVPRLNPYQGNILTDLLLTSDLKGYIEKPGYYFSDTTLQVRSDLDVLMLTQGYRRFNWNDILTGKDTQKYLPEKGININGRVNYRLKKPSHEQPVFLMDPATGTILSTLTNTRGDFCFPNLLFSDTVRFVLYTANKNNEAEITYVNGKDSIPPVKPANLTLDMTNEERQAIARLAANDSNEQKELRNLIHAIALKGVTINGLREPKRKSQSYVAETNADQVIHGSDIVSGGPLAVRLASLVHGSYILSRGG